ncbi:ATP-binding response regulator [Anaeromyxobacter oryzae]|uniref:histidine kinase n=1 Tax=Anaeromyxobacter oryzae TaxID=2918170 RepID=A0ABN6MWT6_9BACT|nr:hybrid sensor histidine kinase/response regulator [Anaeromyxobacter oryzae]BDG04720.1 hypothetical protein AMOR_37160 [Anaeromyxobacter oryzae]
MTAQARAAEQLLVLAPTGRDAALAARVLEQARLACEICPDVPRLVAALEGGAGGLLLAEEVLVGATPGTLAEWVARQPAWSDLPIIVVTSASSPIEPGFALARLAPLGNVTLLERPLRRDTLVSVARSALRARKRQYAARDVLAAREQDVRARDQFLAMLGHELRNPLGAITMALEVIDRRGGAEERQLAIVRRQAHQLARIVDDLLDVARVTSGKIALHRVPIELGTVAARCVEALQPQAHERGVALALDEPAGAVALLADPVRLEQVIANLAGNALKYTPAGGHVTVTIGSDGGEAVLRVRDDGIGIPRDQLSRVFETFAQVDTSLDRARGGLGLGLTVSRSIVAMHGGTIEAASEGPGRGSEFVVRLPVENGDGPATAALAPAGDRRRRVLVIDDSDDNRSALRLALEHLGHEVAEAEDGKTGLQRAVADGAEVVVVDIGLPGIDGFEVARRIRAARGRSVLLVALTGYGQPDDRRMALEAGFDVHLTKPVQLDTLARVIRREPT